jgi:hypothetical protein
MRGLARGARWWATYWATAKRCALTRGQTGRGTLGSTDPIVAPGPTACMLPPIQGRNDAGPNRL